MKKILFLSILLTAACVSNEKKLYALKLMAGDTLYTKSEPKKVNGFYEFYDINGQFFIIKDNLILSITKEEFKK